VLCRFALTAANRGIFVVAGVFWDFENEFKSGGTPPHSKALAMPRESDLDVAYVARLARLNLTEAETELFQKQLGEVLNYADKLREVDVSHVEPAAHAVPIFNVFREDDPRDWFTAEEALSNAPRKMPVRLGPNSLFIVPKVVE